ncbi:MAG: MBOAT family protein [Lachnospiraceae bacterium]|jgi:alginate O-acetyltransferase complex protein AlgI|nr:MBOAT family protein [Lachnospiraceae bacterium]
MVFSSLLFIFRFLPVFLAVYRLTPARFRNQVLFAGSLVFYAWGEPVYLMLMLFSAFFDYGNGLMLEYAEQHRKTGLAGVVLTGSILVNLSLLAIFKYSGVLPLPVGISFYTFQTMSYTIDVYRGEVPAQRNLWAFGAYVSMFPQLIAGPVVKYRDVEAELAARTMDVRGGYEGIGRFCTGLGKKVLLANQIGLLWEAVQKIPPEQMSMLTAWLGSGAFALQLYFDFSGYSDMAIGLARMLGFHLKENFDYPYTSGSITEFWRRWHISLGQWFREYVYIPLGGNRKGFLVQMRNLLIVWALTGIWHGRGWNFLIWGLYFGVLLILEKCVLLRWLARVPRLCGHIYTMAAVTAGMTIFAVEDPGGGLRQAWMLFAGAPVFCNMQSIWLLSNYGILFFLCLLGALGAGKRLGKYPAVWAAAGILSVAYIVDASYNPFLYFRF